MSAETVVNDVTGHGLMTSEVMLRQVKAEQAAIMKASTSIIGPLGAMLREWRAARRMSQLDLALEAGISARHLSCVETGKARASRETIARLADALEIPLRERNGLLLAGGYAPYYPENPLAAPALERMRQAVDLIITHHEPYPAFVIDRCWEVLGANSAAGRINTLLMNGRESRHNNLLHQLFDPGDLRPMVANWAEVAVRFMRHLHEQITAAPSDDAARELMGALLQYPGVPQNWRFPEMSDTFSPVVPLVFASPRGELRFFETITTFAAPRDVTLDEIRIDCAFPADRFTAELCAELALAEPGTKDSAAP